MKQFKMGRLTRIGKDDLKRLHQIVNLLIENPDTEAFRTPVNTKEFPDYIEMIKKPIDLGTVQKKLQAGKYRWIEECLHDLSKIWENCKAYNSPESWIYETAEKLEKLTKKYIRNYLSQFYKPPPIKKFLKKKQDEIENSENPEIEQNDPVEQPDEPISHDDKLEFVYQIKQLLPEQINQIVSIVQKEGGGGSFNELKKDHYQMVVDNIIPSTFKKCTRQMEIWQQQSHKKIKK